MSLVNVFDVPVDYQALPNGIGVPVYSENTGVQKQFSRVYELNEKASEIQGREVWDDYEIILMKAHKDTNIVAHRANDAHRREFKKQYERFKAGESGELGTPLDKLYNITTRQLAQLGHHSIHTIEQAASMPESLEFEDQVYSDIKRRAGLWLKGKSEIIRADDSEKAVHILTVQVSEKDAEIEKLRAEILAMRQAPKRSHKKKEVVKCDE